MQNCCTNIASPTGLEPCDEVSLRSTANFPAGRFAPVRASAPGCSYASNQAVNEKRTGERMLSCSFLAPPTGLEPCDKVSFATLAQPRLCFAKIAPVAQQVAPRFPYASNSAREENEKRTAFRRFAFRWLPLLDLNQ